MLVVVAIIVALAGLVFAVIGYGVRRARQTTCANNLRQLVTAFALYAADYDTRLLPAMPKDKWYTEEFEVHLRSAYAPYVSGPDLWFCPSQPRAGMPAEGRRWPPAIGNTYYRTYAYYFLDSMDGRIPYYQSRTDRPHWIVKDTRLIGDEMEERQSDGSMRSLLPYPHGSTRHSVANVGFSDGHVATMSEQQMVDYVTGEHVP
jgi:prepilin-type processing-associated H-X9-DG protein